MVSEGEEEGELGYFGDEGKEGGRVFKREKGRVRIF